MTKLSALGSGFKIVEAGKEKMVQSVPLELSVDHTKALSTCGESGYTTHSKLQTMTGWDGQRTKTTLEFLLQNEFAWIDTQSDEPQFWIVGMLNGAAGQI